ncbi:MAG: hypothetical protein PHI23_02715 [Candidatus Peribacteraceae bacterium]|nr:hypothetical protein [Candidatus Peribacteraceae bacterium]
METLAPMAVAEKQEAPRAILSWISGKTQDALSRLLAAGRDAGTAIGEGLKSVNWKDELRRITAELAKRSLEGALLGV